MACGARVVPLAARCLVLAPCATMLLATLVGCGGVADDVAGACIDLDGPEFSTASLPAATAGRAYSATVMVGLAREPHDDWFDYAFQIRGTLPPGLRTHQVENQRRLEIAGTPTASGEFGFTVSVSVTEPDADDEDGPALCWFAAEKYYRIVVEPGG